MWALWLLSCEVPEDAICARAAEPLVTAWVEGEPPFDGSATVSLVVRGPRPVVSAWARRGDHERALVEADGVWSGSLPGDGDEVLVFVEDDCGHGTSQTVVLPACAEDPGPVEGGLFRADAGVVLESVVVGVVVLEDEAVDTVMIRAVDAEVGPVASLQDGVAEIHVTTGYLLDHQDAEGEVFLEALAWGSCPTPRPVGGRLKVTLPPPP